MRCSMHERGEKSIEVYLKLVEGREHAENRGVSWRKILNKSYENSVRGRELINLAQDRDRWQVPANILRNFWFPLS